MKHFTRTKGRRKNRRTLRRTFRRKSYRNKKIKGGWGLTSNVSPFAFPRSKNNALALTGGWGPVAPL
jgi:hypothetical protein